LQAEDALKRHGKSLIETLPEETTELLKKLCTNYVPVSDNPCATFHRPPLLLCRYLIPSFSAAVPTAGQKSANPDHFVHIFVDQVEWLVKFLEYIVDKRLATTVIYNTLLELYLRDDEDVCPLFC